MKLSPLLAVLLAATLAAQEPAPNPVRLVYEMPVDALQRSLKDRPEMDLEQLLAEAIANVQSRVPKGFQVSRSEATMFTVDLPDATGANLEEVRATIEVAGKFEMRIIAYGDYDEEGVTFDLAEERRRLAKWLDAGNRERLQRDPRVIEEFHRDQDNGPAAGRNIKWFVRRIHPRQGDPRRWNQPFADYAALRDARLTAYTEADWNDAVIPAHIQALQPERRFLIELIAINMRETFFTTRDLDPKRTRAVKGFRGAAAVSYHLVPERGGEYEDFSEKYLNKSCAMIWEDEVLSAPVFRARIPGVGRVDGMSKLEAAVMARAMRAPLVAKPRLIRMEPR